MLSLHDDISKLKLMNAAGEKALRHLGINTASDLLYHFPRDWQDLTEIKPITGIRPGETINIKARVKEISVKRTWKRRMTITEALLEDDSAVVRAVWFNQPYLANILHKDREYFFTGKGQIYNDRNAAALQLQNPKFELVKTETIHTAGIIPVYQLTEGVTQKQLRYWLKQSLDDIDNINDFLPRELLKKLKLPSLQAALSKLHFPKKQKDIEEARQRLAFDELFLFQLALTSYKKQLKILPAPAISINTKLIKNFVEHLPFKLTNSQRLAAWDIISDMAKPHPMNRLLEGEVGSGKTVVAGIGMLGAAKAGYQSVLLAPTEILAMQHYETLKKLLGHTNLEIALLTRSHKTHNPNSIFQIPIIIGTHALLQNSVSLEKTGLLVVDEQHRFGVEQRAKLAQENKGLVPHLLSMSATPIPRTLALAFYGDLDISVLKELPKGRKKIITKLVRPDGREIAYKFVRQEIKKGQQAYVIVPLVGEEPVIASPESSSGRGNLIGIASGSTPRNDEDNKTEKKSVISEVQKLRKIFPEFTIGMIHGRMKGGEKKQVMEDFKSGKIQILVSTTVVEVGVDVANAALMIIENAERFGLAQLHQLRGRIGRSELQSYCLLFAESANETTRQRLQAVVDSTDGFELAEIDLKLRGSGEVLGTRQSGFAPFKIARASDQKLIRLARKEAENLLEKDEKLSAFPILRGKVEKLAKNAHLE